MQTMPLQSLLQQCPLGCTATIFPTTLQLPEGALLCCAGCGQWLSQCSAERYQATMQEFNQAGVTLPHGKTIQRAFKMHKKRLALIQKYFSQPPSQLTLLDVGCSSGAFLANAKTLGYIASGVEPAQQAAATAAAQDLTVHCGYLQDIAFANASFDIITLFEVIEHLTEPAKLLSECWRILKPNGLMLIGTGNTASWTVQSMGANWEYFSLNQHGGHISFFNPASLTQLAEKVGFNVRQIKTRCVKFAEKNTSTKNQYRLLKFCSELLNMPAQLAGKGHDMLAVLQKPEL